MTRPTAPAARASTAWNCVPATAIAKLLRKIEQALERIEDGSYGYCEDTGEGSA